MAALDSACQIAHFLITGVNASSCEQLFPHPSLMLSYIPQDNFSIQYLLPNRNAPALAFLTATSNVKKISFRQCFYVILSL